MSAAAGQAPAFPPLPTIAKCPFDTLHGCNGYSAAGNSFSGLGFLRHLETKHLSTPSQLSDISRYLSISYGGFQIFSSLLASLHRWMCFQTHSPRCTPITCRGPLCYRGRRLPPRTVVCSRILLGAVPGHARQHSCPTCGCLAQASGTIVGIRCPPTPPRSHISRTPGRLLLVEDAPPVPFDTTLLDKVLRCNIPTLASVPPSCRLAFSDLYCSVLEQIVASPNEVASWLELFLLPKCILRYPSVQSLPTNRRSQSQVAAIRTALHTWSQPDGPRLLALQALENGHPYPDSSAPPSDEQRARRSLRHGSNGHYGRAIKCLSDGGIAPANLDTLTKLQELHPTAPLPDSIPVDFDAVAPLDVPTPIVLRSLLSFQKGTAPGRDGLRVQHLYDCFRGIASTNSQRFLAALTAVCQLLLRGGCPVDLAPFLASASLTPFAKDNGGVRPIAVGLVLRRLVSKVALHLISPPLPPLPDYQFGVGTRHAAEGILHAVNRLLRGYRQAADLVIATVDIKNAFNSISRVSIFDAVTEHHPSLLPWIQLLYGHQSHLYYRDQALVSSSGVQQGCNLGPKLFDLGIKRLVESLSTSAGLLLNAWYLDDGTLIGSYSAVSAALRLLETDGPKIGLQINHSKCALYWPSINPARIVEVGISSHIPVANDGLTLLGGAVSLDLDYLKTVAQARFTKAAAQMARLPILHDPQLQLLLLRNCLSLPKINYTLRTLPWEEVRFVGDTYDEALASSLSDLLGVDRSQLPARSCRLAGLPLRDGGLGLLTVADVSYFAFLASTVDTWMLQDHILRNFAGVAPAQFDEALAFLRSQVPAAQVTLPTQNTPSALHSQHSLAEQYFAVKRATFARSLTGRNAVVYQSLIGEHASDFLLALPIAEVQQTMDAADYRAILHYRLLIPLFQDQSQCRACTQFVMDRYGDHALHCTATPGLKRRHDFLRDTIVSLSVEAGIHCRREPPEINFTSQSNHTLLPADVFYPRWLGGPGRRLHACVDVTCVSPTVLVNDVCRGTVAALEAQERAKRDKHQDACERSGEYAFIPFVVDTFGNYATDALSHLARLAKLHGQRNPMRDTVIAAYVWRRVAYAVQRGVGRALAARLASSL